MTNKETRLPIAVPGIDGEEDHVIHAAPPKAATARILRSALRRLSERGRDDQIDRAFTVYLHEAASPDDTAFVIASYESSTVLKVEFLRRLQSRFPDQMAEYLDLERYSDISPPGSGKLRARLREVAMWMQEDGYSMGSTVSFLEDLGGRWGVWDGQPWLRIRSVHDAVMFAYSLTE